MYILEPTANKIIKAVVTIVTMSKIVCILSGVMLFVFNQLIVIVENMSKGIL